MKDQGNGSDFHITTKQLLALGSLQRCGRCTQCHPRNNATHLCFKELSTPVVTRSERPCLSICSASLLISFIFFEDVAGCSPSRRGGVSSPAMEDAVEAFLDPAFDREATVFLGFPSAALFASRAALDAETMLSVVKMLRS